MENKKENRLAGHETAFESTRFDIITYLTNFKHALEAAGLITDDQIIPDGKLHRIQIKGDKSGSKNGWYVLFDGNVPVGIFGSWKTGIKSSWYAKDKSRLTISEKANLQKSLETAQKIQRIEELERHKFASTRACKIWKTASPALNDHPYLVKKGVRSHGLRLYKNMLAIPMRDCAGTLHSLQFIDDEGNKRFLSGGRKKGCYFSISNPTYGLCIAEGYATAASIHEFTGLAVAVAFDAGNLEAVAKALRVKFPNLPIIICADNDDQAEPNIGFTKGLSAAKSIKGILAIPSLTGDFNDFLKGSQK